MSYSLEETAEGIALKVLSQVKWRSFRIDFLQGTLRYRADHLQGRNELIAKAIGYKRDCSLHVFDTTAGLGREAFLLATLGCQVTLFERHPVISKLLKDGLNRALVDERIKPIIHRMTLNETCAIEYLQKTDLPAAPDVIYCDPMFEAAKKSALVKKEMQLLQAVVGEDTDGQHLVALALGKAKKRVVVKRAIDAPSLKDNPHLVLKARSHRYDIYFV